MGIDEIGLLKGRSWPLLLDRGSDRFAARLPHGGWREQKIRPTPGRVESGSVGVTRARLRAGKAYLSDSIEVKARLSRWLVI